MKLIVKNNELNHAGKFENFTIEPPVACYKPYLNRNSIAVSPFIHNLLASTYFKPKKVVLFPISAGSKIFTYSPA